MAGEDGIAIEDDGRWKAVELVNLVHVEEGHLGRWVRMRQRHKVGKPGMLVNEHQETIEPAGLWEPIHEVHSDHLPWLRWYWEGF